MDRPSSLFDHDFDSTRQLAQTLLLPGILVQALRVEQQCGVPVLPGVCTRGCLIFTTLHMRVCSGGHCCNDFAGSRHLWAFARSCASRSSEQTCLCVIRNCSIMSLIREARQSSERASVTLRSSGGVCACFAFVRSRDCLSKVLASSSKYLVDLLFQRTVCPISFLTLSPFCRVQCCRSLRDGLSWHIWHGVISVRCGASSFTGILHPGVHDHTPLEVCKCPWSLWGSRGCAPHGCMLLMDRIPDAVPWSPCSHSPLSSRAQPLGSGGDAPCEDTREDFGLSGGLLSVAFKVSPNLTKHWENSSYYWGPRGRLVPVRRSRHCRRQTRGHGHS